MTKRTLQLVGLIILTVLAVGLLIYVYLRPQNKTLIVNQVKNLNPYPIISNQFSNLGQTTKNQIDNLTTNLTSSNGLKDLNRYNLEVADYDLITSSSSSLWLAAEKKTGYLYIGNSTSTDKTKISSVPFLNTRHLGVIPNKNNLLILVKNQNPGNNPSVKAIRFDLTTSSSSISELPTNIDDFAINPSRDSIILIQNAGQSSNWIQTDADLTKFNRIYTTHYQNFVLDWINSKTILFYSKPSSNLVGQAYLFNLETNQTTKLVSGVGLEVVASSDNQSFIYSTSDNRSTAATFHYQNQNFSIPTTASKCRLFNDFNALCAVPSDYINNIDDWYKGRELTADNLFLIDNQTGANSQWRKLNNLDVVNIKQTTDRNLTFFIDRKTNELWSALAD